MRRSAKQEEKEAKMVCTSTTWTAPDAGAYWSDLVSLVSRRPIAGITHDGVAALAWKALQAASERALNAGGRSGLIIREAAILGGYDLQRVIAAAEQSRDDRRNENYWKAWQADERARRERTLTAGSAQVEVDHEDWAMRQARLRAEQTERELTDEAAGTRN